MGDSTFPRILLGAIFFSLSFQLPAATLVVNPNGGAFTTIQSAVDAANPGDTISIKPHPDPKGYRENVVIDTPDLTLKGSGSAGASTFAQRCPKVVLDGCETPDNATGCGATVLQINEPDTRILSLTVRHGEIDIDTADRTRIEKICVIDADNDAVGTENGASHDVVVKNSVFQGGRSESIDIDGDNAQVLNNRLFPTDDGIEVTGDNALVKSNRMAACNDKCIEVNGANGRVEKNILDGGDDGIDYLGDQPFITGNRIEHMYDDAINVSCTACTGGTISKNKIVGASDDDEGIAVFTAENILIERNTISNIDQNAIELFGNNSTIRNNKISRSGTESISESCIQISGSSNTVEKNKISYCTFHGIRHNSGDDSVFSENNITGSGRAGIEIEGGSDNLIIKNTINSSQGEGIANTGGTNTDIEDNKVKKSRTDICNNASVDSFTGNTFATGGIATSCVVDS